MKIIKTLPILLIVLLMSFDKVGAQESNSLYNVSSYEGKGVQAPNTNFTGTVWLNTLVTPDDHVNSIMGKVTFDDKARTNWHKHRKGQVLIVTDGVGYYQEKDKPVLLIKKGDVVKIPANTEHWHGASSESFMSHFAIVADAEKGSTEWLQPVTEKEYNSYKPQKKN